MRIIEGFATIMFRNFILLNIVLAFINNEKTSNKQLSKTGIINVIIVRGNIIKLTMGIARILINKDNILIW